MTITAKRSPADVGILITLARKKGKKRVALPGRTLADFDYIKSQKRLIIPTLFDNEIVCYIVDVPD